eukprot:CAMPEP_0202896430 /NCGR_PEP_ID=MMETSP1392-20130828/5443_1 /ASSEMBLY_ACC=CAM_ASM_000868 /TAXON_ID=225041 /ORGANISM="Chlamydomonas chlamydogama, Strain SAG 11-48b" /LENGTH=510 /DNA_ID=CAMNT_0049581793 /DNA_START=69 /DNA_END=1601 /DNA_ORIENTATION=-
MSPSKTNLVAAIDQGTQSTRVFLFDKDFQPVAQHQVPLPQIYPEAGWCEHDPLAIWGTVKECITQAVQEAESKVGPVNVRALGITNQRETTVVWHKHTGQPLYNAVVWLDTRTSDLCSRIQEEVGGKDYFRPVTGLPISTYFSAFKFKWMYDNVPAVREAVDADLACFGTVDSWLIYQLTGGSSRGVHVTDVTNASRTMLMDLRTCQWHEAYFPLFSMRASALPRIVSNSEVYGTVSEGPLADVPICGCLGDQMAAMLGQRCVAGEAKNTYGTGCFMLLNTGSSPITSNHGLLTTVAFKLGPQADTQYALEGAVAVAGMGISWMQKNMGMIESPDEVEPLAASVTNSGGVYFVPAFSGLLAPRWEDSARGVIVGLTGFTTRAHVARAMLDAICFQSREVLDAMRRDADLDNLQVLRVDGGAAKNDLLMQMQADILQVPVVRPHFQETTSLGAAFAAGLAVHMYTHEQIFTSHAYNRTEFKPQEPVEQTEKRYALWHKAVARSMDLADLMP